MKYHFDDGSESLGAESADIRGRNSARHVAEKDNRRANMYLDRRMHCTPLGNANLQHVAIDRRSVSSSACTLRRLEIFEHDEANTPRYASHRIAEQLDVKNFPNITEELANTGGVG